MDEYVPRVGHLVRVDNVPHEVIKVKEYGYRLQNLVKVYDRFWIVPELVDEIHYIPRHKADGVNHSFRHANPDDLYFDPDDESADEFFAYYQPKHRA